MLASNRAFLQERFPSILSKIQNLQKTLSVEKARNGLATCKYHGRFMHSPYDPGREARDTLASLGYAGQPVVLLMSAGLGHCFTALGPSVKTVIVIEKDSAVFEALCGTTDLSAFAKKIENLKIENLILLVDPQDSEVAACLDSLDSDSLTGLFIWEHRPVTDADADSVRFYDRVRKIVKTRLDRLLSEINTTGYFAPVWFANTMRNLKFLDGSVDLSAFKTAFASFPAAVVSAGPTLDETVSGLKPMADRFVIIAAATAVRRLLASGIVPHFVVSTDAGYYNSCHTKGLDLRSSIFVSDLSVNHLVPRTTGSRTCGSRTNGSRRAWIDFSLGFHDLFTRPGLELPRFNMAGTVASTSVELACFLGCSQIWLFGQDFSFVDGRSHCKRTMYESYNLLRQSRTSTFDTAEARSIYTEKMEHDVNYNDKRVMTSVKLKLYKDWFEKQYRGLRQTSSKSAKLSNAPCEDFSSEAGRSGVAERLNGLIRTMKWKPDNRIRGLIAEAEKKLDSAGSEKDGSLKAYMAELDPRLSAGLRTYIEFEVFRASRVSPDGGFPASVRGKIRDYLHTLSRAI